MIYLSSAAVSTSVTGGANGTTTTSANAYGATSGMAGVTTTNLTESQIPGVTSGATCKATLASVAEFGAMVEGGRWCSTGKPPSKWARRASRRTARTHQRRLRPPQRYAVAGADYLAAGRSIYLRGSGCLARPKLYLPVGGAGSLGSTRVHGPYTVTPVESAQQVAKVAFVAESPADSGAGYDDPAQGYQAIPHAL